MILKSYLVLISYLMVQNSATVIDRMDMHDVNSIEIFINNVRERAWSYYRAEKATLSVNEKKGILKMVFHDLTNILTELNNMSADSSKVLSSGSLVSLISTLEKHTPKNGLILHTKLSDKLRKIFDISEAINSYVEPLLQLGANDDQDVLKFCPTDADAGQEFKSEYERQIILKEYKEFVENLTARINDNKLFNVCGQTTSLNQAVFEYYHHVIATYLKEYVMLYYIDIIDARCLNLNAAPLLWMRQNETLSELKENTKLTKEFLATSNYSIINCDVNGNSTVNKFTEPKTPLNDNGESFYELERLFQTIIIAENELNNENSCKHNCNLNQMQSHASHPECKKFMDCQYITHGYDICLPVNDSSSRRYEWFEDANHNYYGYNFHECNPKRESKYSYFRPSSVNTCDYCVCTCVGKPQPKQNVVTAISFRGQVTNLTENMVVVGVRFVKKDYMIHVQIKERKFSSNSSDKAHWKELEDFEYNSYFEKYYVKYGIVGFGLKEGADYGHPENISFGEVIAPEGYVVTGVRFSFSEDSLDNPKLKSGLIELQIRVTPFKYAEGLVNIEETRWIVPNEVPNRKPLFLRDAHLPKKWIANHVDSMPDQYVKFQPSNLLTDAGQSTVPFFDSQDVEGDPEFPLGGVGLIHRGSSRCGGFLAFRIYDLNLSKFFKD